MPRRSRTTISPAFLSTAATAQARDSVSPSIIAVKSELCDHLAGRQGHHVTYGESAGNAIANLRRGNLDVPRDRGKFRQERHPGAREYHELRRLAEVRNVLPGVEFGQIVIADEIVEFCAGIAFAKKLHGIYRERGSLAFDFAGIHLEVWLVGD